MHFTTIMCNSFTSITFLFIVCFQSVSAQENIACLACHSDRELIAFDDNDMEILLFVDERVLSTSAHNDFFCADCHIDLDESAEFGHESPLAEVDCTGCHENAAEGFNTSIHGQLLSMGDTEVPNCSGCHGTHNIFSASDSRSTVNKFNLMFTCAECH